MNLRSAVRPPPCSPPFNSFTWPLLFAISSHMPSCGNLHLSTVFLHMVSYGSLRPFVVLSHTVPCEPLPACNPLVCSHFWTVFAFGSRPTHHACGSNSSFRSHSTNGYPWQLSPFHSLLTHGLAAHLSANFSRQHTVAIASTLYLLACSLMHGCFSSALPARGCYSQCLLPRSPLS